MHPDELRKIIVAREGGHVERVHYTPHHGTYKVAEHTFQMLILLDALHPNPPLELYRGILLHDVMERFVGDVPASAKRAFPEIRVLLHASEDIIAQKIGMDIPNLRGDNLSWLVALDTIEFLLWVDDQLSLGNKHMKHKRDEVETWLKANWNTLPNRCQQFLEIYRWQRTPDFQG